jgi:hypothetical protein
MFFKHLKNIEKVSKTVDERMQKRKVQKEWSTKVISETARLRDEEGGGLVKVSMNTNTHTGERSPGNDNADIALRVDAFDDDDNGFYLLGLRLGTPQSDDRDPESMEEEVPTSQSQERYLSPPGAPCGLRTDQRIIDQWQPPNIIRCADDFTRAGCGHGRIGRSRSANEPL